ncbi:hypothetical protein KDL01_09100 [Actinospica durhamensis]|uniref:Uncharacterized protein n=1 Tax=Actinospica durhamensis TaxID=1508375 RepID=A0A941ELP1_9ACTN|nr:hypothetical protein [Actinospica durhamensis]MBR7833421.1 hypothetical protein [Actinospica durhamensis]
MSEQIGFADYVAARRERWVRAGVPAHRGPAHRRGAPVDATIKELS